MPPAATHIYILIVRALILSARRVTEDPFLCVSACVRACVRPFAVLEGLHRLVSEAQGRADVRAIVLTGTKGKFSGGFDITQLKAMTEGKQSPKMNFNEVLNAVVESGPKPTVAGAFESSFPNVFSCPTLSARCRQPPHFLFYFSQPRRCV